MSEIDIISTVAVLIIVGCTLGFILAVWAFWPVIVGAIAAVALFCWIDSLMHYLLDVDEE